MAVLAVLLCFALYLAGYVIYSRYLAEKVFGLRAETFQALLADRDALARLAARIEARLEAAETRHG